MSNAPEPWLERTLELLQSLDPSGPAAPSRKSPLIPTTMTLRGRKEKTINSVAPAKTTEVLVEAKNGKNGKGRATGRVPVPTPSSPSNDESRSSSSESKSGEEHSERQVPGIAGKRLPKVVLRLGPDPRALSAPKELP